MNEFREYQNKNPQCKYFAAYIMDKTRGGAYADNWGAYGMGKAEFGCGNTMDEAKKNAKNKCD